MTGKIPLEPVKSTAKRQETDQSYKYGRGAQFNTPNRFSSTQTGKDHAEGIDDWSEANPATQYILSQAASIVNKVDSPDVGMLYSMNPYAGCEHGCIYCYARNVHEYWGYSAGLDFEQKIIVKQNAPMLLRKFLMHPKWDGTPISISGNTDCYQPAEHKFRLTRQLLEVCLEFNQPVGLITKNAGMLRDKNIITEMAKRNLISILVSVTSFNEDLRRVMEPRTTTATQRVRLIRELSDAGVRMGVMLGPMIPGLNDQEMQRILYTASQQGARFAAYTFIRLNGAVKWLFHQWLFSNFPDRAQKVWSLIEQGHNGQVNDNRWGLRMRGEGPLAHMIAQQFKKYSRMYGLDTGRWALDSGRFQRPGLQGTLF